MALGVLLAHYRHGYCGVDESRFCGHSIGRNVLLELGSKHLFVGAILLDRYLHDGGPFTHYRLIQYSDTGRVSFDQRCGCNAYCGQVRETTDDALLEYWLRTLIVARCHICLC